MNVGSPKGAGQSFASSITQAVFVALATAAAANADVPQAATGGDAYRYLERYAGESYLEAGTEPKLHRTGTPGGDATAAWIAAELAALGLTPAIEEFPFVRFEPAEASLDVGGFRPTVLPFYYSGVTLAEGVTAPLVDVGLGTPLDFALAGNVTGKIALIDVPAVQNAFVPTFEPALEGAANAGAVAVVASIRGPLNYIAAQNSDSRGGVCNLPTLIVGKEDGAKLRLRDGAPATFVLDAAHDAADVPTGKAANVVATIHGETNDAVVIGTPYNGWFAAAAERGAGIGTLLTLARHYAAQSDPPRQTLVFVATAGHEIGFLGLEQFIRAHSGEETDGLIGRTTAYVHLGATLAAKEYDEVAGVVVEACVAATCLAEETRSLFISENPLLIAIGETAMRTRLTGPMASVPPSVQNPGEQQFMYRARVPMVSMSGGHLWFHTPADLPSTTTPELLDPIVAGFREIIDRLLALDRETVRSANAAADALVQETSDEGAAVQQCQ